MRTAELGGSERLRPFLDVGLDLNRTLIEMLSEHPVHCTERRGCGFTQATRHLADRINTPRDPLDAADLGLLAGWRLESVERFAQQAQQAGWPLGWRELHRAPDAVVAALACLPGQMDLLRIAPSLRTIEEEADLPEVRLLAGLLRQILGAGSRFHPALPAMPEKPAIGSCSQAEEFFLEIAHGKVRRGGRVNVYCGTDRAPLLVEKIDLGESHSAMAVAPVRLNNVVLPPGSLFALRAASGAAVLGETPRGCVLPLSAIEQARFLRLSTLSVSPQDRPRVFSRQFAHQVQMDFLSPASTTIADLDAFARAQIGIAR